MNKRLAFKTILCCFCSSILIYGCGSPYLAKGHHALKTHNYSIAYKNFKLAPGLPGADSKIAAGLTKASEGLARQAVIQANEEIQKAEKSNIFGKKASYNKAVSKLDEAIRWYSEAKRYADIFLKGSGKSYATLITILKNEREKNQKLLHEAIRMYELSKARRFFDDGYYQSAVFQYKRVLALKWPDSHTNIDIIHSELLNTRCQLVRKKINEESWRDAGLIIDQILQSKYPDADAKLVQQIQREYIQARVLHVNKMLNQKKWKEAEIALFHLLRPPYIDVSRQTIESFKGRYNKRYSEHLNQAALKAFKEGNIYDAIELLKESATHASLKGQQLLIRIQSYKTAIDEALNKAESDYEKLARKYVDHISPEIACGLESLEIKKINLKSDNKNILEWLFNHHIGVGDIKNVIIHFLTPSYKLSNRPDAYVHASFNVNISNNRWRLSLEMWAEKNGKKLFIKRNDLLTGEYDIYIGLGPFKKIREDQAPIIRASLKALTQKTIKLFIPFGKCKKNIVFKNAFNSMIEILGNSLAQEDLNTLRSIIEVKIDSL